MKLGLAILLLPAIAHATLDVVTAADLMKSASKIAIIVTDGHGKGTVATAIRGVKIGDVIDVQLDIAATALYVCDGNDCAAAFDRGGYYILHLPGRKGALLVEPGLFEVSAIDGLAKGMGAKPLCIEATLELTDEPLKQPILTGKFNAEDGRGTLAIEGKTYPGQLTVGGPTHNESTTADIRLDNGAEFRGGYLVRNARGCFAFPVQATPLARTPRRLATVLAGKGTPHPIARGTLGGKPIAIGSDATVTSGLVTADLFGQMVATDHSVHLIYYANNKPELMLTMRIPLWFREVSAAAQLAHFFADGKPHEIELSDVKEPFTDGVEPKALFSRGKAVLVRVDDP